MPLLDHFGPPIHPARCWGSFLANWATRVADSLTDQVSRQILVEEYCPSTASPDRDTVEVLLFALPSHALLGAIELVSPRNRDSQAGRLAFTTRCVDYLRQGAGLIIIDIVTVGQVNLHDDLIQRVGDGTRATMLDTGKQYAVAFRPVRREGRLVLDVWQTIYAVGDTLPTMPLCLAGDTAMPVDFEATYQEARQRRRLA